MKAIHILIGILSVAFIAGCGASSHDIAGTSQNVGPVDQKALSGDVVGTWLSTKCDKLSNTSSNQQELDFTGDKKYSSSLREFTNPNCSGTNYFYSNEEVSDSTYSLDSNSSFASGQIQIGADKDQTRSCDSSQGIDPFECMQGPVKVFIGSKGNKMSVTFNGRTEVFARAASSN